MRGVPFTREKVLTGAVFHGGDNIPPSSGTGQDNLCCIMECLLNKEVLGGLIQKYNINLELLKKCINEHCCKRVTQPPVG
jgi:hypothetical protein